jgi:isoleucyl-tRNA synthetase
MNMFKPVDPKQSFPEVEHKIQKYWEDNKIFEKSVKARKDRKKYVFFDGPPFANGLPHYGHILANALKDAVTRYWTMKGYYVPRTNGWDCHGLPVEYEIEKNLELSGRKDIVDYGIDKFNDECRKSVFKYTGEWTEMFKRIGRWVDFDDTYATLDNDYMESIWWIFKQIWDQGLIYSGHKSMHICPRCETPLSNFEVTQGYKDVTDLSVTCKFKLKGKGENVHILAWTTTPWTLPGNVALALGPDVKYVKFAIKNFPEYPDGTYIAAETFYKEKFEHYDKVGEGKVPKSAILETVDPKTLEGRDYEPLFDFYVDKLDGKTAYKIYLADFVTTEDGTGIVHIAPMFGEDDYQFGLKHDLAMLQHVGMDGCFADAVKPWAGKFVKGQDLNVAVWLYDKGLLFEKQNFRHSYPHCWRCDTPLLNYSTRSLFVEVTKIKNKLLKNNEKIQWVPSHIQHGRFGKWLDGARDWAISRNRFWGSPIPLWECKCGEQVCVGSVKELEKLSGKLPKNKGKIDLHKPYIDRVKIKCKKCGKMMSRIPDVLDCWFESGAMPYAQLHYPFENKKYFEDNFPANFIAEGLDQTRGWFYTLHVLSTILFDKPAFKNVIVNGILLAADGEKLSKRKKNYPDPNHLFDAKGVDSLRYFLYSSTSPLAEDVRFSEAHVDEVIKKFTLTFWNTYSFFVTYANIDKFKALDSAKAARFKPTNKLDQWILSELNVLIKEVTENMDAYNLTWATRPMQDFLENLSNWYVRRSRRRFWKSENDDDKTQAYQTLYMVLTTFCKLLAPFMPFISDEVFINLTGKKSVHMEDWPKVRESLVNEDLNKEMAAIRKIVNLGHSVRGKARIKVRQPLAKVQIALPRGIQKKWIKEQKDVVLEELNVKDLEMVDEVGDLIEQSAIPDARLLGPKYGKDVQKIIQDAKAGKFTVQKDGKVKVGKFILEVNEVEIGYKGKEGYDVESEDGVVVVLDTNVTKGLVHEGYAREVVRYVQEMRKEADYEVSDRIYLLVRAEGEIEKAVTGFADYIEKETLTIELSQAGELEYDIAKNVEVAGQPVKIELRKA